MVRNHPRIMKVGHMSEPKFKNGDYILVGKTSFEILEPVETRYGIFYDALKHGYERKPVPVIVCEDLLLQYGSYTAMVEK